MVTKTIRSGSNLTKEQSDLIQRFEADYNSVDSCLRNKFSCDREVPFNELLRMYSDQHPGWRDTSILRKIAHVRNAIVHEKTEAYEYVAIPTPDFANRLRICRDRLNNPALIIPQFQKAVTTVSTSDTLESVLRLVRERNFSQFPVYDGDHFCGLITENGITRWLANHVAAETSLVELQDVTVKQVIPNDEKVRNYSFVARNIHVDDLVVQFAAQHAVEAMLITANGKQNEKLLGIVTRWDIVHATS